MCDGGAFLLIYKSLLIWYTDTQNRVRLTTSVGCRSFVDLLFSLRLANHRIFQQLTTNWCPEREEHGYFLTPLFKCNTNPRVATAHRWAVVDVIARLDRPTGPRVFHPLDVQATNFEQSASTTRTESGTMLAFIKQSDSTI